MNAMANNQVLIPLNQSALSQKICPSLEKLIPANANDLILYFVTKPPSAVGFGKPDLGAGYVQRPGDSPVRPTLHPIYATQQQDSIKSHVEAELVPMTTRLKDAGYKVSIVVGFDKDPVEAIMRVIAENKIDLVAMSTRARVGVTRFFFRNIADEISQKAKIPVLRIHPSKS
jgi:nucleotide-binding universal stress UspA family protein